MLTLDTVVTQDDTLATAEVGGDLVMLHVERNAYYDTDSIGAEIWRRLSSPVAISDLCRGLTEIYDVDEAGCAADVLAFLEEARREGLLRILGEAGQSEAGPKR